MYGTHVSRHGESNFRGEKLNNPARDFQPVPFGNAVALNVGKGGPGTGRTIYQRGTQGQQGEVAGSPRPQGRDILSSFGPDYRK
jgi:hypothetical protein